MKLSKNFDRFNDFLSVYLEFVAKTDMIENTAILKQKAENELSRRLISYLNNDPEWKKAYENEKTSTSEFDYKYPFIIAEGMCFLENILIPEVFKGN